MKSLYEANEINSPIDITKATKRFKSRVILAITGLVLFVSAYIGLMLWFFYKSYTIFKSLAYVEEYRFWVVLLAILILLMAVFMLKSLFIFKREKVVNPIQVTEKDEPVLFDFVNKLADEVKAPRPHKVFLSPRVNACVFYDLNILNIIFPTKKNLEIGLGLVNVLTLDEFKAVLAHEFGHFAQKSMMLGRYVYVAQQIAVRVVNKRDAFDGFIRGISSIDIRIAWIGWILSILIWAIRALIEVLFSIVVFAERALSREMEFQADLVAVSVTGSDSLINALFKLRAADEAYHASLNSMDTRLKEGKAVEDLFALQENYLIQMRKILSDQSYGGVSENFVEGKKSKVFHLKGIRPPEMWASHPTDDLREENAKRTYIPSKLDSRKSWVLFSNPDEIRKKMTKFLYDNSEKLPKHEYITREESVDLMNKDDFNWVFLNPKYKGIYLNRSLFGQFNNVSDVYDDQLKFQDYKTVYSELYPDDCSDKVEQLQSLEIEKIQFQSVLQEPSTFEKRDLFYNERKISKSEIPEILNKIQLEIDKLNLELIKHDTRCRTLNYRVAESIGPEYAAYHKSISSVIHYAEHKSNIIHYQLTQFQGAVNVAMAGGRSSSEQVQDVVTFAIALNKSLRSVFVFAESVELDQNILKRLGKDSFNDLFEEYGLGSPTRETINEWMQYLEGWLNMAMQNLQLLKNAGIEALLIYENELRNYVETGVKPNLPAGKNNLPDNYQTLVPEKMQFKDFKLSFFDRFLAGYGTVPTLAKFCASVLLIWGTIAASSFTENFKLIIYNGLGTTVHVEVNDDIFRTLAPNEKSKINIEYGKDYHFIAKTSSGLIIDDFHEEMIERAPFHVYNIGGGARMLEYRAFYGYEGEPVEKIIGNKKWFASYADYVLDEPPTQIRASGSGEYRDVLQSTYNYDPTSIPLEMNEQDVEMIENHVKFDDPNSKFLTSWFILSGMVDSSYSLIYKRIDDDFIDVMAYRYIQDYAGEERKATICQEIYSKLEVDTTNADLFYLSCRCIDDEKIQDDKFILGSKKWPEHDWMSYAAAHVRAGHGEWEKSYEAFEKAVNKNEALANYAAVDFERVRRMTDFGEDESNFLANNENVKIIRDLEKGDEAQVKYGMEGCYYKLSLGQFDEAIELAQNQDEFLEQQFKWMLAASDSAPQNVIDEVLNYNLEAINYNNAFAALIVYLKNNKDVGPIVSLISTDYGIADSLNIVEFNKAISDKDFQACEDIFTKIDDFRIVPKFAMIGVALYGEEVPEHWREMVKRLLFVYEKPYFKSTVDHNRPKENTVNYSNHKFGIDGVELNVEQ